MNDVGFTVKPTNDNGKLRWDFPQGTVIVKEVYQIPKPAAGELPIQLTIMVKAPKDPHSQGGWLWITRDLPDGKEAVFMGNFCITCHANANEKHPYGDGNPNEEFRDYVNFVAGKGVPTRGQGPSGQPAAREAEEGKPHGRPESASLSGTAKLRRNSLDTLRGPSNAYR